MLCNVALKEEQTHQVEQALQLTQHLLCLLYLLMNVSTSQKEKN